MRTKDKSIIENQFGLKHPKAYWEKIFFLLVVSLILRLFFLSAVHCQTIPKINIMTEIWEPYNFQEDGVAIGISTDMLVLMLKRIGSAQDRKDIKIYPWARAYEMCLNKPNTMLFTTARTQEREEKFKWVGPIFEIEFYIYALKSRHIKINSFNDLKNYRIGTPRGDVVEDLLIKHAGIKNFDRASSNLYNMKKLMTRRIDLIAQSKDTTISVCKEEGFNPDEFEPVFLLDKKSMYYAFQRQTPDSVIKIFQTAFDDLKNEGKLAEIFKNYGK